MWQSCRELAERYRRDPEDDQERVVPSASRATFEECPATVTSCTHHVTPEVVVDRNGRGCSTLGCARDGQSWTKKRSRLRVNRSREDPLDGRASSRRSASHPHAVVPHLRERRSRGGTTESYRDTRISRMEQPSVDCRREVARRKYTVFRVELRPRVSKRVSRATSGKALDASGTPLCAFEQNRARGAREIRCGMGARVESKVAGARRPGSRGHVPGVQRSRRRVRSWPAGTPNGLVRHPLPLRCEARKDGRHQASERSVQPARTTRATAGDTTATRRTARDD